jgi:uncharacterized protein (TIGR02246 family)
MRHTRSTTLLCCLALLCAASFAQSPAANPASPAAKAVRQVLEAQQSAWNRGDIDAFMQGYNNSPDTVFIGTTIQRGYSAVLARYKKTYATRAAMGTLAFSDLYIQILSPNYAVATGKFHLTRAAKAGGDASGFFTLILQHQPQGWKIILDHTTP